MNEIGLTALLARASEVLLENGFRRVAEDVDQAKSAHVRLFEDPFSIVGLSGHSSVTELSDRWQLIEATLGSWLAGRLIIGEPKNWDVYLILITPETPTESDAQAIEAVEANTSRTRKLVVSGATIATLDDVEGSLAALLPLVTPVSEVPAPDPLTVLPDLLEDRGLDPSVARALVNAWQENDVVISRVHEAIHGASD